jgi:hypothetical protein
LARAAIIGATIDFEMNITDKDRQIGIPLLIL